MGDSTIVVGSTSVSLSQTPASPADIVLTSILEGSDMVGALLDHKMNSMARVSDKVYRYAKDHYTLGLPGGSVGGVQQVEPTVIQPIIEAEIGQSIIIDYSFIDILQAETATLPFLYAQRGYANGDSSVTQHPFILSPDVNVNWTGVNEQNNLPVYITDISLSNTATTVTATISYKHDYLVYTGTNENDQADTRNITTYTETFTEDVVIAPQYRVGEYYCITTYYRVDTLGAIVENSHTLWLYALDDQTYPQLLVASSAFGSESFMPVIPIRWDNYNLNQDDTDLTRTSKKLLKKMNMDMDSMTANLNDSPDIAEIDHALVMFGIRANSDDQDDLHYLTEYFDYLADAQKYTQTAHMTARQTFDTPPNNRWRLWAGLTPYEELDFISVIEHGLNMSISFDYITSVTKVGVIGEKYFASKEVILGHTYRYDERVRSGDAYNGETYLEKVLIPDDTLIYRLQVTDTQYKEVSIKNPGHGNHVYKAYTVITGGADLLDPENTSFIVPVHYGIAKMLPSSIRSRVLNNSLIMVINTIQKISKEWYEHSFFKFLVSAVGVIAIVVTSGGATGWMAGITAAAEGGVGALMVALAVSGLKALLISIITNYAFSFIAEALGAEFAAILGMVMAFAAVFGSIKGKLPIGAIADIPTAQALMASGQALIKASNKMVIDALTSIQKEMLEWQEQSSLQMEELDKAMELLKPTTLLNPLDWIMTPHIVTNFDESPTGFYNRTIHNGNPGVATKDVISNYYKLMLKLPDAHS